MNLFKEACNEPIVLPFSVGVTTCIILGIYVSVSKDHNSYDPKTFNTLLVIGSLLTLVFLLRAWCCPPSRGIDSNNVAATIQLGGLSLA